MNGSCKKAEREKNPMEFSCRRTTGRGDGAVSEPNPGYGRHSQSLRSGGKTGLLASLKPQLSWFILSLFLFSQVCNVLTVAKTVQIGRWGGLQCEGSPFFLQTLLKISHWLQGCGRVRILITCWDVFGLRGNLRDPFVWDSVGWGGKLQCTDKNA